MDEAFHRAAFKASRDPSAVVSRSGIVLDANAAFVSLFGASRVQRGETRLRTLFAAPEIADLVAAGDSCGPYDVVAADERGGTIQISLTITRVTEERALLVARDVTEQRRRELLAERYQLMSRYTKDIVFFIAQNGDLVEVNDAAVETYGYSREELLAMRIHDLREPSSRDEVDGQMVAAFQAGVRFDTIHRKNDGSTFPVEVSSRSAIVGGTWMLLSIIRDITERRDLHARLVQADRLSAFGLMAAGIAHEINNPLAYAMTNAELLERMLTRAKADLQSAAPETALSMAEKVRRELEGREASLQTMREGLVRVRNIVRDLRTFSRDDGRPAPVDVRAVLESTMRLSHGELSHRARVTRAYGELPEVMGQASRLGQVFLNLVINAAQAIDEGGTIEIAASFDDARVYVEVKDDGPGIDRSIRDRVFAPFFTTKPAGEGTGLGLYISRTLVTEMGGTIEAHDREPRGTVMRVTLPRAHCALPGN